jgi:hypothetical protein
MRFLSSGWIVAHPEITPCIDLISPTLAPAAQLRRALAVPLWA